MASPDEYPEKYQKELNLETTPKPEEPPRAGSAQGLRSTQLNTVLHP